MGYTGTIGRRVWAIVKPLSGRNARQTSLSPFDSSFSLVVVERNAGTIILLFSNTSPPLLSLVFFPFFFFFFSTWLNWAWQCWKLKKKVVANTRRTIDPLRRAQMIGIRFSLPFLFFFFPLFSRIVRGLSTTCLSSLNELWRFVQSLFLSGRFFFLRNLCSKKQECVHSSRRVESKIYISKRFTRTPNVCSIYTGGVEACVNERSGSEPGAVEEGFSWGCQLGLCIARNTMTWAFRRAKIRNLGRFAGLLICKKSVLLYLP